MDRRRLGAVATHLLPAGAAAEPATAEPGPSGTPLTPEEMRSFLERGFHCCDVRGELPAAFHRTFTDKSWELWQRANSGGEEGWLELEDDIRTLLQAPCVHGALSSLLGADFHMSCAWATQPGYGGMMGNHHTVDNPDYDQPYHKVTPAPARPALPPPSPLIAPLHSL